MRRLLTLPFLAAAFLLGGCGDPAPSTPVAPDQAPLPDASKMTKEEVDAAHNAASQIGSDRGAPGGAPTREGG